MSNPMRNLEFVMTQAAVGSTTFCWIKIASISHLSEVLWQGEQVMFTKEDVGVVVNKTENECPDRQTVLEGICWNM